MMRAFKVHLYEEKWKAWGQFSWRRDLGNRGGFHRPKRKRDWSALGPHGGDSGQADLCGPEPFKEAPHKVDTTAHWPLPAGMEGCGQM